MKDSNEGEVNYFTKQRLTEQSSIHFSSKRFQLTRVLTTLGFVALCIRATIIHLTPPSSSILKQLAEKQYNRKVSLASYRGTIFDRRNDPLAISVRKPSLFVNPKVFRPSAEQAQFISQQLRIPKSKVYSLSKRNSYFAWMKRKVPERVEKEIVALNINGLHSVLEPARYYPSTLAPQLIGYVGTDNTGLLGLELSLNEILSVDSTKNTVRKDGKGRLIHQESQSAAPTESGHNIYLTLDRVIQDISEKALEKGVKEARAKSGFALVTDPHSGHILAVANYPKFDPNKSISMTSENTRNFAFLNLFEPGSVTKPLVAAKALDLKKTSPQELFDVNGGLYRDGALRIRDSHPYQSLSTSDIIINSSNIGIYKVAQKIGPSALSSSLKSFGISNKELLLDSKQQSTGRISPWKSWRKSRFANISFGQGLLVTGLEMTQAYGALANGGRLMKPIIVERIEDRSGKTLTRSLPTVIHEVISSKAANQVSRMLYQTVERGTGKRAQSSNYTVAGKTGTSEKVDPVKGGYSDTLRIASFIGFSPVYDPHLVIYVVIDEPQNKPYYGGRWAAPVFKEINEQSLRYLNVKSDKNMVISKN